MSNTNADTSIIDVRTLPPAQRHQKIFQFVNELAAGRSFILVNDHDPKPLYYQLEAEYPKQFGWTYVESGPTVWRVEIGEVRQSRLNMLGGSGRDRLASSDPEGERKQP
jgi:uncharacterized protein (DUF2249 family)